MDDAEAVVAELFERLSRYPASTYPVQHATTRFHLGVALLQCGRAEEAEGSLRDAARVFERRLPLEFAKAQNMLGVALRSQGRPAQAAAAFEVAAGIFEAQGRQVEQAASCYNLGLVRREQGDDTAAEGCFATAFRLFRQAGAAGQASAAARELGALLLAAGDAETATETLGQAVEWARRTGEQSGVGAAANVLGLAQLAAGRPEAAVDALGTAVAASPRRVRPDLHAMAKANLALAHEQAGDLPRARLAARQAAAVPEAPEAVLAQAGALLERLGEADDDLVAVLDQEPPGSWPGLIREEVARLATESASRRQVAAKAWIRGLLARPDRAVDLAEAWLAVLLELPPADLEDAVRATLAAVAAEEAQAASRLRRWLSSAMPRFHTPQWLRREATFDRVASQEGLAERWS